MDSPEYDTATKSQHSHTASGPTDPSPSDGGSDGHRVAIVAHLAGEPDTLPPQWCKNCSVEVVPRGKGLCPRCGRVLKHSFLAR